MTSSMSDLGKAWEPIVRVSPASPLIWSNIKGEILVRLLLAYVTFFPLIYVSQVIGLDGMTIDIDFEP